MSQHCQLSVFITTYNNQRTLAACLDSVRWADELVILDSFSSDATLEIAARYTARIAQHAFMGYGAQKRLALEMTSHNWVLLLDADEALSPALQTEIQQLLRDIPPAAGYTMPRQEQLFWRMYHPATRMTRLAAGKRPLHIARLGGYYQPRGYRHAHAWITVSAGIADHLLQHGFPKQRVFHISNFLTPRPPSSATSLQQLRSTLNLPPEALIVTAVGRLHPIKGFADLLSAFAALPRQIAQRPVYLLMVGDGPLAATLQRQAQQLEITQRVRWLGWRNDAGRFQELADVCVCSSLQEGIGNVILEAWAQRRAVLATRTVGPMEIARHAEDAWLVPVNDPAALAQGMELLLSAAPLREMLAANGYQTLLTRHSEEAIVSAYLDVYRQLLAC